MTHMQAVKNKCITDKCSGYENMFTHYDTHRSVKSEYMYITDNVATMIKTHYTNNAHTYL